MTVCLQSRTNLLRPHPLPPGGNLTAAHDPVKSRLVGLALVGDPQLASTSRLDGFGGQYRHLGGKLATGAGQGVQLGGEGGARGLEAAEFILGRGCLGGVGIGRSSRRLRRLRHG